MTTTKVLAALVIATQVGDALTQSIGLHTAGAYEANPVSAAEMAFPGEYLLIKLALGLAVAGLVLFVAREGYRSAIIGATVATLIGLVGITSNVVAILH